MKSKEGAVAGTGKFSSPQQILSIAIRESTEPYLTFTGSYSKAFQSTKGDHTRKPSVSTQKQVHASVFKLALDYGSDKRKTCQQFMCRLSGVVIYDEVWLFISVKQFTVLRAPEECPKSGIFQLKSEYSIIEHLRTPCNIGLSFGGLHRLFKNRKWQRHPIWNYSFTQNRAREEHLRKTADALSLVSHRSSDQLLPPIFPPWWDW